MRLLIQLFMFLPKLSVLRESSKSGVWHQGREGYNNDWCCKWLGNHVPPMLIVPRVHFKKHMFTGAPRASIGGANPTCWSNERLFVDYLKQFIAHEKTLYARPVLLMSSPTCQSQPSMWYKKMVFSCSNCRPVHHVSYSHLNVLSRLPLMIGCCQTHANQ